MYHVSLQTYKGVTQPLSDFCRMISLQDQTGRNWLPQGQDK